MILHHLPQFTSQLRTQFARNARRTCIFIQNRSFRVLPGNSMELDAVEDSTITGVSVYPHKAEITRTFALNVATGQNQLNISGLPGMVDNNSIRIEERGRGAATIHGVTISGINSPTDLESSKSSERLEDLLNKKRRIEKNCKRAETVRAKLDQYLNFSKMKPTEDLDDVLEDYETAAEDRDDTILNLKDELYETNEEISDEKKRLWRGNSGSGVKVSVGVLTDFQGAIDIALIYAVYGSWWKAGYDVRVDKKKKDKPVTLTYKARIKQDTGEDWNNVPVTLETDTPTFGLEVPALKTWNISFGKFPTESETNTLNPFSAANEELSMDVSSTSNGGGTFQVPGLISVPSDGNCHNVTIAELNLDAKFSWVCVPKKGAKTYLIAKIKNASPYTFLHGESSVNVDGSVISKSEVPPVCPGESFDCPLNVDPSIQVIYHPRSKKVFRSGICTKTTHYMVSQRITIANTKKEPIENLKIVDQIPVSKDSKMTVKMVRPALRVPGEGFGCGSGEPKVPPPVSVASGVVAQWHGADEAGVDVEALGKDGKLNWVCAVPAQEKIGLVLQWEVLAPVNSRLSWY